MHFFPPESDAVIRVSALTRRFGATTALDSVNLSLPRGAVYGLVGANGAGKTTLIKHILGLLKAERGSVRVDELMRYSRALYPAWDDRYAEEVKQVADHVTMINHGKILLSAPLPDIKESHRVGERLPSLDEIFVSHAGATAAPAGDR